MKQTKRLIVLDTSVLIILAGGLYPPEIDHARERAGQILDDHDNDVLSITAPGLSECFGIVDPSQINVLPMDAKSSFWAYKIRDPLLKRRKGDAIKIEKRKITVDSMILGTALAHKAAIIYSIDDWFLKTVTSLALDIQVRGLPEFKPVQQELRLVSSDGIVHPELII